MNLLFIGDVVGNGGRDMLSKCLYDIKREYKIDITVINGENSAQGNGVTPQSYRELINLGADVVTTGNHAFRRQEAEELYEIEDRLLRPANYPEGVIGKGVYIIDMGACQVAVINLMGTLYLDSVENPFNYVDKLLAMGASPIALTRIIAVSCLTLDSLPHNSANIITFQACGVEFKEGYYHFVFCTIISTTLATIITVVMSTLGIY